MNILDYIYFHLYFFYKRSTQFSVVCHLAVTMFGVACSYVKLKTKLCFV